MSFLRLHAQIMQGSGNFLFIYHLWVGSDVLVNKHDFCQRIIEDLKMGLHFQRSPVYNRPFTAYFIDHIIVLYCIFNSTQHNNRATSYKGDLYSYILLFKLAVALLAMISFFHLQHFMAVSWWGKTYQLMDHRHHKIMQVLSCIKICKRGSNTATTNMHQGLM